MTRLSSDAWIVHAAASADVKDFYKTVSAMSFTLLGFWWVVVQLKYKDGSGDPRRRRHGYAVLLYFLLPGVMTMISSVNTDLGTFWRLAFGISGVLGLIEVGLYAAGFQIRSPGATALRACAAVLYLLIILVAASPPLAPQLLGMTGQEVESILVALLVVVGVNLAWFGVTEPAESAQT
jgi:hypothetical protein